MGQNLDAMVIDRFGRQAFLKPVLVPRGFLPTTYDGSEAAVRSLFAAMCVHAGVPADAVELRFDRTLRVRGGPPQTGGSRAGLCRLLIG